MKHIVASKQYSDTDVITKVLSGETALYEIIIRRYNPYLHKTGRTYGFNHEDTQDLMQETFVNAFLNLSKFENRASFKTWLTTIMLRNCSRKKQKFSFKNEFARPIDENSLPMYSTNRNNDVSKEITNKELNQSIEKALLNIPEIYRLAFILREVNGMSTLESAESLGISEVNVKVRLSRAKILLRKELEKSYSPEDIFDFNLIYCDTMVNRVMTEIVKISN